MSTDWTTGESALHMIENFLQQSTEAHILPDSLRLFTPFLITALHFAEDLAKQGIDPVEHLEKIHASEPLLKDVETGWVDALRDKFGLKLPPPPAEPEPAPVHEDQASLSEVDSHPEASTSPEHETEPVSAESQAAELGVSDTASAAPESLEPLAEPAEQAAVSPEAAPQAASTELPQEPAPIAESTAEPASEPSKESALAES